MNRRQFLHHTGLLSAAAVLGSRVESHAAPEAEIIGTRIISHEPQYYHGWPTVARRRNGQLLVVCSGGREGHICPFGRVELIVSSDNGQSWSWPQVLQDSPIDDRDAGVLETAKGTILVSTFTSVAYEPTLAKAEKQKPGEAGAWPAERLSAWRAAHQRLTAEQRHAELGEWVIRSTDGGNSWSLRIPTIVNSPHGPIQLADGRLLYAGKELWTGEKRVGVCESLDDGRTWRWLAAIPARPGDDSAQYHELHAVEAGDGRILVHIRNHNKANQNETLQTESSDSGKSWSVPHPIGVWGLPSFLLRLHDGKLLMTYGHRRPPFGNQARLSEDNGRTWSEPVIVSGDGAGGDLGYPSTVELEDRSLLSVWYESLKGSPRAVLRQAHWRLKS
jgi:sialidase-1